MSVDIATALCARETEGETLDPGKNRRSAACGNETPLRAASAKACVSAGDTLGMLGVRGDGVGVSKSATDCRGEPLSRWKLARSPEGVSATDTLDRAEDVTCCPAWCDWDWDWDWDWDRACPPLWAGVTGSMNPGGTWGGGGGDTGGYETRDGVWTAEDAYTTFVPAVALET